MMIINIVTYIYIHTYMRLKTREDTGALNYEQSGEG